MYQQLWGYKVEDELYLGVREQKRLNTTAVNNCRIVLCVSTVSDECRISDQLLIDFIGSYTYDHQLTLRDSAVYGSNTPGR
jgi:hypothetical protein